MKYWHNLLHNWREKGKNGFTIPYLIGSQKFLSNNVDFQNLNELIYDIANNEEVDIYITYCTDLNDLILGIRDESKLKIAGKFICFGNSERSNLFLTKIADNLGETLEEVVNSLNSKYQDALENNEYSTNNRTRGDFSQSEQSFIKESFEKKAPNKP